MDWIKDNVISNFSLKRSAVAALIFLPITAAGFIVFGILYSHLGGLNLDELPSKYGISAGENKNELSVPIADKLIPIKSFVLVKLTTWIIPDRCTANVGVCEPKKPWKTRSIGSGAVIGKKKHVTYVLTAAHVCAHMDSSLILIKDKPYTYDYSSTVKIVDASGVERPALVIARNVDKELCLLQVPGSWAEPVPIAEGYPEMGARVYNMSAPMGVFEPGMTLIFDGIYSGHNKEASFFTIPSAPGCSGSPVLNHNGEIVGVIHSTPRDFPAFALASRLKDIQQFIADVNLLN